MNKYDSMDDMRTNALEMMAEIQAKINEMKDDRTKEVGDRVKIWDGSGNRDKDTDEERYGSCELFKSDAIVIATGLSVPNITQYDFEPKYILDILVKFPNGEEVYTKSEFVARTDNYKN